MTRITNKETVFANSWIRVAARHVEGPGFDGMDPYYSLEQTDYVHVLAVTAGGEVLRVRQYRPALESFTLELPSGHLDPGETPEQTARRELEEETGHTATDFRLLGCLHPDTGRLSNRMWCFLAVDAVPLADAATPSEPGLEIVVQDLDELLREVVAGSELNCMDLATVMLALSRGHIELPSRRTGAGASAPAE